MQTRRGLVVATALLLATFLTGCETAPVTGRSQFILLSDTEATKMGLQAYQKILSESKVSTNRRMTERVRRIGRRIAAVSGKPNLKWEFNVIENDTPNAFALPGGKVGVHTGLFKVAKNDNQLAAVMAHEVAHAIARHSAERVSQQTALQLGLAGLGVASPGAGQYAQLAAAAASLGVILPFSRKQESEADEIGLMYMARAGYDPRAAVDLWRNFESFGGGRPPEFLSTHPSPGTRIDRLKALMPKALAVYKKGK